MDADWLHVNMPNHEEKGVFARDPTLKDFVRSGPACLASLTDLWSYARAHAANDCYQVIEDFVANGCDEGNTEPILRSACGVKEKAPAISSAQQPAKVFDPREADLESLSSASQVIMNIVLDSTKDVITLPQLCLAKTTLLPGTSGQREDLMKRLVNAGMWAKTEVLLSKTGVSDAF